MRQAVVSPNPAEQMLVIHTAGRISKGVAQPKETRTAATVAGISCMDAVFRTMSLHNSFDAMPSFRLRARHCAAWIPIGVAAFPSPRKLAQIFALKQEARYGSFLEEGNTRPSSGPSSLDNKPVKPAFSISLPTPVQRQIEPANDMASVMPACAPCGMAAASSLPRPKRIDATKEIATIPVNIQLITMSIPPINQPMRLSVGEYHGGEGIDIFCCLGV